ncbi:MFS transporter [Agarilytica rhodophyticola]|uniref:MFS transporter n=1 Tax=Agarilytica rhodophyticola TaxID=1737490 RepID=UPI000B341B0F|nr:MFS transporter [Agarilytica rhodophyticola]
MIKKHADINVTKYSFIAAFGGFVFGLDAANISGAIRYVSSQFSLSSLQVGTVVGVAILGVILALLFTGALCDRYGRRKVLIVISLTYSLSTLLSATAINYPMLVVGRFIGGVAFASITVSAMYIGEIAPSDRRGKFVSVSQLLITLGSLLAFLANYILVLTIDSMAWINEENVWRFMLGFEFIPNIIWFVLLLKIPESPRWLVMKGRLEESHQVFSKVAPSDHIEQLVSAVRKSIDDDTRYSPLEQLQILFSRPMKMMVLIALAYAFVQGASGMNAVLFYAPTVFEQLGMSVQDTFMQTVILGVVSVIFTVVAISFVEKWGRRVLTIIGLALIVSAHFSTWYGFKSAYYTMNENAVVKIAEQNIDTSKLNELIGNVYNSDVSLKKDLAAVFSKKELPLVSGPIINATINIQAIYVLFGIFTFLAAFNMSIGPVMWVLFSEIFPNKIRSVALPFAAFVQSVSSYLIQQFFPWQLENLGAATTFLSYGLIALLGLIVMIFILPETKGKSIEQIELSLKLA